MKEVPTFYYVYCINGGTPRHPHTTEESAENEAKRLATCNPGVVFVVIETREPTRGFMVEPPKELDSWEIRRKVRELFPEPKPEPAQELSEGQHLL